MDVKKFAGSLTSNLHFKDLNGDLMYAEGADGKPDRSKPMRATMYGPGSKQFARVQAAEANRIISRMQDQAVDQKNPQTESGDQRIQSEIDAASELTDSFENIEYDGLAGRDLIVAVYSDPLLWFLRQQANRYPRDSANFRRPSTAN